MSSNYLPADLLSAPAEAAGRIRLGVLPSAALVPAASTLVAVALPSILVDLSLGPTGIWWLVTGYLVLMAVLQTPAGRLADRVGHRRMIRVGLGLLVMGALSAAVAPSAAPLVASRLVQGVAGAVIVPAGLALIRGRMLETRRSGAVGDLLGAMATGALVGVGVGGIVVEAAGWRVAFTSLGLLATVALLLSGLIQPSPAPQEGTFPSPLTVRAGGLGIRVPFIGIALANLALYVVLLTIPLRREAGGGSAAFSGVLLVGLIASSAVGSVTESRLAARLGHRGVAVSGTLAAGLGLLGAGIAPSEWLLPGLMVVGGGLGVAISALYSRGLGASLPERAGSISGMLSTARYAGSISGSAALPVLLSLGGPPAGLFLAAGSALAVTVLVARTKDR